MLVFCFQVWIFPHSRQLRGTLSAVGAKCERTLLNANPIYILTVNISFSKIPDIRMSF